MRRALIAMAVGAVTAGALAAEVILGVAPTYGPSRLTSVPNAAAITQRMWVPGLDPGYTPQGLAMVGNALFVSAYRSERRGVNRGPCRVFRLDPASGRETGHADVPAPCGHAGGLAYAGGDTLYLTDTHDLFALPLMSAFAGAGPVPYRHFPLGLGLVGALGVSTQGAIWIGTYREDGPGRLYRFTAADLARMADGETLSISRASGEIAIPSYAQGAAFGNDGKLWVARSDTRWGELHRLDPATGAVERRYTTAPGIEGIAFDPQGRLWGVSEAGARHAYDDFFLRLFSPFYPLIFAIDPARLE